MKTVFNQWLGFLIILGFLQIQTTFLPATELKVFDFATTQAARAAWQPGANMSPVGLFNGIEGIEKKGVRFPCLFNPEANRCYWDTTIQADLSKEEVISLRVFVDNFEPIAFLTLYFRSTGGWYAGSFDDLKKGWQTLRLNKSEFLIEDTPSGWNNITGIRFSPWKASDQTTHIIATELKAHTPSIVIVKGTRNIDTYYVNYATSLISSCLDAYSIEYSLINDEDVDSGGLTGKKLAIFPYNDNMSEAEQTEIETFVSGSGKIILFYQAPSRVATLLGLKNTGWISITTGAMKFISGMVECLPDRAMQASWNITLWQKTSPQTRDLAWWETPQGTQTNYQAWFLGINGALMTHVLLNDDLEKKQRLILALVANFVPDIGSTVEKSAIERIGVIGPYASYEEAVEGIQADALYTSRKSTIDQHLSQAAMLRQVSMLSQTTGTLCQILDLAEASRRHMLEAFYYSQHSQVPEFRAVWEHAGTGAYPGDWNRSAENLVGNGFTAIFPNMLWGGVAHYNSAYLPHSDVFQQYGDQISSCVEACHARGIEVHVWKVNWNLLNAPQDFVNNMRTQNRAQVDVSGNPVDWLCPSNPLNYELELNSMLEVATKYDVDGLHFDYIRYPDETCCYCTPCRQRFENETGTIVTDWPTQCYSGSLKESYRAWRVKQITRLVEGVSQAVRQLRPKVKISAAVFPDYPSCRDYIGQDWLGWVQSRALDFVCPMDYRESAEVFRNYVKEQLKLVNGKIPVYPGVGAFILTPDQTVNQLGITREFPTRGFIIFNYDSNLAEHYLPELRKGFTAPDPGQLFMMY